MGSHHQRPGQGHPLLLPAGELPGTPSFQALKAQHSDHPLDAGPDLSLFDLLHAQTKRNVIINR